MSEKKYTRGRRKKSHWLSNIILVVAIVVFAVSAYQLLHIELGYKEGNDEYEEIQDLAISNEDGDDFTVDFNALLAVNPDTIGWIRFNPEPAIINYPIVQTTNNDLYLHKTFSANENTVGAIFMNTYNKADFSDRNTIIYGHRMSDRNGMMFNHLLDYQDQAFWEANPYFYIYLPNGKVRTYHIYSVGQVLDTSDSYITSFANDEEYQTFLNMTKEVAAYDTGVEVGIEDTIITLSTCTKASDEHRFVVRGVLEKEE